MIEKFTLLADLPSENLTRRLTSLFKSCHAIRGVVAYWTIDVDFFSSKLLLEALSKSGSFYCVDIQRPTSIDYLNNFARNGASIHLHAYQLEDYLTGKKLSSPGLLHSKMILFDLPNGKAELWVGSHNVTERAIKGINIEASISIELEQNAPLYLQAKKYLERIKQDCHSFNPEEIDYYKLLQGNTSEAVLERLLKKGDRRILIRKALDLLGYDVLNLHEKMIQLIGIGTGKLQGLTEAKSLIILQALDLVTNDEITYIAKIQQAGMIDINNPQLYGKSDVPRRYALVGKDIIPMLGKAAEAKEEILRQADYFVNIKILAHQVEKTYSYTEESLWKAVPKEKTWVPKQEEEERSQLNLFNRHQSRNVPQVDEEQSPILKKAVFNKDLVLPPFTLKNIPTKAKQEFLNYYKQLESQTKDSKSISQQTTLSKDIKRDGGVRERRLVLYK